MTLLFFISIAHLQAYGQKARFAPDFATVQYAGSIGFMSVGLGYQISDKSSVSFHYGYVPQNKGGTLNVLAGKLLYNTFSLKLSEKLQFDPLKAGVMVSYYLGGEFRSRWPSHRYPDGYYWWKTSLRAHVLTQTSLTLHLKEKGLRSVTGYVEFNTNDLYLISYIQNRHSLNFRDILKLGYGIRANF